MKNFQGHYHVLDRGTERAYFKNIYVQAVQYTYTHTHTFLIDEN